jgi:hypothetical protein
MSTATTYALIARQPGNVIAGASVPQAWPNVTPNGIAPIQNLDILQIVGEGGSILVNVDFLGTVHSPASNATTEAGGIGATRVGQFYTRLTSSASLAAIFADAFENLSQQDILQVISPTGGNITYNLNYLGVAAGS